MLLIQKSILRDAVTDLSLHYLVRGVAYRHLSARGCGFPQGSPIRTQPSARDACPSPYTPL